MSEAFREQNIGPPLLMGVKPWPGMKLHLSQFDQNKRKIKILIEFQPCRQENMEHTDKMLMLRTIADSPILRVVQRLASDSLSSSSSSKRASSSLEEGSSERTCIAHNFRSGKSIQCLQLKARPLNLGWNLWLLDPWSHLSANKKKKFFNQYPNVKFQYREESTSS